MRFTVAEQPTELRPRFLVIDLEAERPMVFTESHDFEVAWTIAQQFNEAECLPPAFDPPGAPTDEPF